MKKSVVIWGRKIINRYCFFFLNPFPSSYLYIFEADTKAFNLSKERKRYEISDICAKYVAINQNNEMTVFIPMQHTLKF